MSKKVLTTFSGKYGDILWSLPTVKKIAELNGGRVDFACMAQYKSLIPLIQAQSYIATAMVDEQWQFHHSNFGDQPWNPQRHTGCITGQAGPYKCQVGWDECWHLGYRQHPGKIMGGQEMQLLDFTAWQQGFSFGQQSPLPFLTAPELNPDEVLYHEGPYVSYAFNEMYAQLKEQFMDVLPTLCSDVTFVNISAFDWCTAADILEKSVCYVGCRSANYVMAHGLRKQVFLYEPHPARNKDGHLGYVFGCNYGEEVCAPLLLPPHAAAHMAAGFIRQWIQYKGDGTHENATA